MYDFQRACLTYVRVIRSGAGWSGAKRVNQTLATQVNFNRQTTEVSHQTAGDWRNAHILKQSSTYFLPQTYSSYNYHTPELGKREQINIDPTWHLKKSTCNGNKVTPFTYLGSREVSKKKTKSISPNKARSFSAGKEFSCFQFWPRANDHILNFS